MLKIFAAVSFVSNVSWTFDSYRQVSLGVSRSRLLFLVMFLTFLIHL